MTRRHAEQVSARLSLRPPQRDSLAILDRVTELLPPAKQYDLADALRKVHEAFPDVAEFERDFPSLTFALATGVGKTRLMGAFVAYLNLAHGIRHFFVLAPNLTIYRKLIADFTPGHPKYVLQGIAEFAQRPPEIITGDDYESGRGVRGLQADAFGGRDVHVNIFNISKINSEVRGGAAPRIKRLSEYIGQSYFDYLAGLDDLVLIMDESHRYRASAGVRAINELRPVLGLELTATPQVETSRGVERFRNIIYDYPLSRALTDGFVKQPAAATRQNFDAASYPAEELERLKLTDGIRIHENTAAELATYAQERGVARVKPFMLVIARDTEHAGALRALIEADEFFEGRYRGKVITVHSNIRGEEKDETVERLLKVESPDEPTEIVIHVNMLKEGWDVTNLYTIVPLRAANARTLVEQSIGRGLRLPYGRRTGVPAVDRLTIVAHDRFQEIVDEANRPESPLRMETLYVGTDIPETPQRAIVIPSNVERVVDGAALPSSDTGGGGAPVTLFPTTAEQAVARTALTAIRRMEYLPSSSSLREPAVREQLVREVTEASAPMQGELDGVTARPDIGAIVDTVAELVGREGIDVPRVSIAPSGEVRTGFHQFDLAPVALRPQPVAESIVVHGLVDNARERIESGSPVELRRPEDRLVDALARYADVPYDENADLLYHVAGQMVSHLRSYLPDDDAVDNVLRHHVAALAAEVHRQLQAHRWEESVGYEARVHRGFTLLRPFGCTVTAGEAARPFRAPVDEPQYIRGLRFTGFRKCCYPEQRFDSDPERRFAVMLEDDPDVIKWFRPAKGQLDITYEGGGYEPDFIVEAQDRKYLCEVKRESQMEDAEVRAKARAAEEWCRHASGHAERYGGKPWVYLLMPHSAVDAAATVDVLGSRYASGG